MQLVARITKAAWQLRYMCPRKPRLTNLLQIIYQCSLLNIELPSSQGNNSSTYSILIEWIELPFWCACWNLHCQLPFPWEPFFSTLKWKRAANSLLLNTGIIEKSVVQMNVYLVVWMRFLVSHWLIGNKLKFNSYYFDILISKVKVGGQGTILRIWCYASISQSTPQTQTPSNCFFLHVFRQTNKRMKES